MSNVIDLSNHRNKNSKEEFSYTLPLEATEKIQGYMKRLNDFDHSFTIANAPTEFVDDVQVYFAKMRDEYRTLVKDLLVALASAETRLDVLGSLLDE